MPVTTTKTWVCTTCRKTEATEFDPQPFAQRPPTGWVWPRSQGPYCSKNCRDIYTRAAHIAQMAANEAFNLELERLLGEACPERKK